MIPQEDISKEDNNARNTTSAFTGVHAKNVNSPRKRKHEKSAAAQRAEKLRMKKRMINPKDDTTPIIDLTSADLSQSDTSPTGCAITNTTLLFRDMLRDNTWLNDTVIQAAQVLIQTRYPTMRGLQDPILGQTLTFDVIREEFVQILHSGGNHWITISTISCPPATVMIYDSLYSNFPHTQKNKYVLYSIQRSPTLI